MKRARNLPRALLAAALLVSSTAGYACAYQFCYFFTCCVYNIKTGVEICGATCRYCECMQAP